MKRLGMLAVLLTLATSASAQTVVTPTSSVQFVASVDQSTTTVDANGQAVPTLTSYVVIVQPPAGGGSVFTRDIGKPTPDASNVIKVPIGWTPTQLAGIAPGNYVAIVRAVGPLGANDSAPSSPFVVAAPGHPPVAAGQPTVTR